MFEWRHSKRAKKQFSSSASGGASLEVCNMLNSMPHPPCVVASKEFLYLPLVDQFIFDGSF